MYGILGRALFRERYSAARCLSQSVNTRGHSSIRGYYVQGFKGRKKHAIYVKDRNPGELNQRIHTREERRWRG